MCKKFRQPLECELMRADLPLGLSVGYLPSCPYRIVKKSDAAASNSSRGETTEAPVPGPGLRPKSRPAPILNPAAEPGDRRLDPDLARCRCRTPPWHGRGGLHQPWGTRPLPGPARVGGGRADPAVASDVAADQPAVACHSDRSQPGIGHEMLKSAREPSPHHLLRRQERQNREQNDAAPGEDA